MKYNYGPSGELFFGPTVYLLLPTVATCLLSSAHANMMGLYSSPLQLGLKESTLLDPGLSFKQLEIKGVNV